MARKKRTTVQAPITDQQLKDEATARMLEWVVKRNNADLRLEHWVAMARDRGLSWDSIGQTLGISGEGARKKYGL